MYNAREYWLERGKKYQANFKYNEKFQLQEEILLDTLQTLSFSSVLEVGCGFGRITKLMLDNFKSISEYTAVDISPDQVSNARRYINSDKVNFVVSDAQSFTPEKKYDLVISIEVLLHIRPDEVQKVMARLLSWADGYFVHVDWYGNEIRHAYSHNFMHDYEQLYSNLGIKYLKKPIRNEKLDANQSLFLVDMKS